MIAGAGAGLVTGLVVGAVAVAVAWWLVPPFLDPLVPAAVAIVAAHGVGGAVLGAVVGLLAGARRAVVVPIAVVVWGALVAGAMRLAGSPPPPAAAAPSGGPRVLVLGLDGGSWRVLAPLLAAGELPAFARLVREGTSGVLTSIDPSFSAVVWTSIATGKMPAKHGVHSFYALQNEDLRAGRFWEVVARRGEPVGVFQWLITWPPDPLPGFVVPGWLARDERTQPAGLAFFKRLEIALQRRAAPPAGEAAAIALRLVRDGTRFASLARGAAWSARALVARDPRATYRAGKMAQLELNADVFLHWYGRWRPSLAAAVFYGADALSHAYWRYHEPDAFGDVPAEDVAALGDTVRDYYRRFDAFLARLLGAHGHDTNILLVSDHGFRATGGRNERAVSAEGLLEAIGETERFHGQALNLQAYLLHRTPAAPGVPADVERAAGKLRALRYRGEPLVTVQVTGPAAITAELRDPWVPLEDVVDTPTGRTPLSALVTATTWTGTHDPEGIILARGPDVRRGTRLARASVLDVAPTVLHLLGLPVAADMDGRVLEELLAAPRPVHTVATHDDAMPTRTARGGGTEEDVTDRLRALGYVR